MGNWSGIFLRILLSFGLFALGLAVAMGIAWYFAASSLSFELLSKRSEILLTTLIEAEKHSVNDEDAQVDPAELISALDLIFLVGKQLDPEYASLPDGAHIINNGKDYIFIKHVDGIAYAIYGSLAPRVDILNNIWAMFLVCGSVAVFVATILAFFLAIWLAHPLHVLASTLEKTVPSQALHISLSYIHRNDEIGSLARTIANYQKNALEYAEREKSFTSAANHELRTPLTILSQGLELVDDRLDSDSEIGKTIRRLLRTTDNMNNLISGLLQVARGEKQELQPINIKSIIIDTINDLKSKYNILLEDGAIKIERVSIK